MESCWPGYKIDHPTIAAIDDCLVVEPHCQLFWICDRLPDHFAGMCKPPLVLQSRVVAFDYYFSILASVHFFFTPLLLLLDKCCSSASSLSGQKTLYFAIHASSSARPFGWRV